MRWSHLATGFLTHFLGSTHPAHPIVATTRTGRSLVGRGLARTARRVASASRGGRSGRDGDRRPRRDEEQVSDQVTEQTGDETTDDLAVATVGGDEGEEA